MSGQEATGERLDEGSPAGHSRRAMAGRSEREVTGIAIADARARGLPISYVSPGFERLTGYRAQQVVGRNCSLLQGPDTDPETVDLLRHDLASGNETYAVLLNYRADGSTFWNEVAIAPQHDETGKLIQFLGVQRDVTTRRQTEARYRSLAYLDSLTGLANRVALDEQLGAAVRQAESTGGQLSLFFVDIDDFKDINDEHGHAAGDAVLRQVAARLRSVIRPDDLVARPGGDEFLMLIRDMSEAARVNELAGRVVDAFQMPFELDGLPPLTVRASLGISRYPGHAQTAEGLLRSADAAMYTAKQSGKNDWRTSGPITESGDEPSLVNRAVVEDEPSPTRDTGFDGDDLRRRLDRIEGRLNLAHGQIDLGSDASTALRAASRELLMIRERLAAPAGGARTG